MDAIVLFVLERDSVLVLSGSFFFALSIEIHESVSVRASAKDTLTL